MTNEKKVVAVLLGLLTLFVVAAVVQEAFAQLPKNSVRWPRQATVNAAAVGDTAFTLPEMQPVTFPTSTPPGFFLTITAIGGVALPHMGTYELLADGPGVTLRLLNLTANSARYDSLCVDSMGTATNVYVFGY